MNNSLAQIDFPAIRGSIGVKYNYPYQFINALLPYIFSIAGIYFLVNIVLSGFTLLTSAGDPKKIAMARGKITTSIVGLLVIAFAYTIVQLIGKIFGIEDIKSMF